MSITSVQCMPSELMQCIFRLLVHPADLLNSALTCRAWMLLALEVLWYKPNVNRMSAWIAIDDLLCKRALTHTPTMLNYNALLRRVNLSMIGPEVGDRDIACLQWCRHLERVTLTGCCNLTDDGLLQFLGTRRRKNLVSIDLSDVSRVTDATILRIAGICPDLQGLNLSVCKESMNAFPSITDASIIFLAKQCRSLRRIKLHHCLRITDEAAVAVAKHCPALLEIDFVNCKIANAALHAVLERSRQLRELRVNHSINISDAAFTQSALVWGPTRMGYYDQLRILDLTNLPLLTDEGIACIIQAAPKIRHLGLDKCYNISDKSVATICKLGRYLRYLHLGHCSQLTDHGIVQLAHKCTRIRYIDLACCNRLTDRSVIALATLSKLKRIGLVKCTNITDQSIYALTSNSRLAHSLERVHLSYCNQLSVPAIVQLVCFCKNLTHLSLSQVTAFQRHDFQQFCYQPPSDFFEDQQAFICVFSGKNMRDLRNYFKNHFDFLTGFDPLEPHAAYTTAADMTRGIPIGHEPVRHRSTSMLLLDRYDLCEDIGIL